MPLGYPSQSVDLCCSDHSEEREINCDYDVRCCQACCSSGWTFRSRLLAKRGRRHA